MLLAFTEKSVSASINATITAFDPATFCISDSDSDFSDFIKDDFVESLISSAV